MIGQTMTLQLLQIWKDNNCFPRFIIITGPKGCGKKTLASYITKKYLNAFEVHPGSSVEAVRTSINNSYKCAGTTAYIFEDADKMSSQAKNALLKITEEPPRQAYFIMTVENINNTLTTLKSRATEIQMESYLYSELASLVDIANDNDRLALEIATNPGQLQELRSLNVEEFYAFCEKVLDNIASVTGVNAFKIGSSFKFKEDAEGYDPNLFFECIKSICLERAGKTDSYEKILAFLSTIVKTNEYQRDLSLTGVKKDSTFDMWILEMRKIWSEVE